MTKAEIITIWIIWAIIEVAIVGSWLLAPNGSGIDNLVIGGSIGITYVAVLLTVLSRIFR